MKRTNHNTCPYTTAKRVALLTARDEAQEIEREYSQIRQRQGIIEQNEPDLQIHDTNFDLDNNSHRENPSFDDNLDLDGNPGLDDDPELYENLDLDDNSDLDDYSDPDNSEIENE